MQQEELALESPASSLEAEELLLQLVECCRKEPESSGRSANGGSKPVEVLFELDIGSYQYTLTRCDCHPPEPPIHLSPREQEVVRLVSKGLSNRAIAAVLEISPWTVSTHLRRIFNKLSVSSRAEMVADVLKKRLLEPGDNA